MKSNESHSERVIDLGVCTSVSLSLPHTDSLMQTLATVDDSGAVGLLTIPAKSDAPPYVLFSFINAESECVHVELTQDTVLGLTKLLKSYANADIGEFAPSVN